MTVLADLRPAKRAEKVREALERVSRRMSEPLPTAELVKLLADDLATRETDLIASVLDRAIKPTWPHVEQTGETFTRYGRTMYRWRWLPAASSKPRKPAGAEMVEPVDPLAPIEPGEFTFLEDEE